MGGDGCNHVLERIDVQLVVIRSCSVWTSIVCCIVGRITRRAPLGEIGCQIEIICLVVIGNGQSGMASVAEVLHHLEVIMVFFGLAGATPGIALGMAEGEHGADAAIADIARIQPDELTKSIERPEGHIHDPPEMMGRITHGHGRHTGRGTDNRRIDINRTRLHRYAFKVFGLEHLIGIELTTANIIKRCAIQQPAHFGRIEAANVRLTCVETEGIGLGNIGCRHHRHDLLQVHARGQLGDEVVCNGLDSFGRCFDTQQTTAWLTGTTAATGYGNFFRLRPRHDRSGSRIGDRRSDRCNHRCYGGFGRPVGGRMMLVACRRGGRYLNTACKSGTCEQHLKTAMRETGRHRVAFPSALDKTSGPIRL